MSTLRVEVLGTGGSDTGNPTQFAMSYIINDRLAIDAGTLGLLSPVERQTDIQHVLLSHSHMDHVATLPMFLDNVYRPGPEAVTVYASQHVLHSLHNDIFNDVVWPDLIRLSRAETPFLELRQLEPYESVEIRGLRITPIPVDHVVPTFAFLIESERTAVAIISDTGPTNAVWETLSAVPHLAGIFLEACFPNELEWLAEVSCHLTPQLFARELDKLNRSVPVYAIHLKPAHREQIIRELRALDRSEVYAANAGDVYEF